MCTYKIKHEAPLTKVKAKNISTQVYHIVGSNQFTKNNLFHSQFTCKLIIGHFIYIKKFYIFLYFLKKAYSSAMLYGALLNPNQGINKSAFDIHLKYLMSI